MVELLIKLGLNTTALTTGLSRTRGQFQAWSADVNRRMIGMFTGALTASAMIGAFRNAVLQIKKLSTAARILDVPVEDLQALEYAAAKSGKNIDEMIDAMKRFRTQLGMAALGMKRPQMLLEGLGITEAEIKSGNLLRIMEKLRALVVDRKISAELGTALTRLGGRSFIALLLTDIRAVREEAQKAGFIWGNQQVEQMLELRKQWYLLGLYLRGPFIQIMLQIGRLLELITKGLSLLGGGLAATAREMGRASVEGKGERRAGTLLAREGLRRMMAGDLPGGSALFAQGVLGYWRGWVGEPRKARHDEWARMVEQWEATKKRWQTSEPGGAAFDLPAIFGKQAGTASSTMLTASVTNAQRVGAYIAVQPMVAELRRANDSLDEIRASLDDLNEKFDEPVEE